jgi:hypothetical protein
MIPYVGLYQAKKSLALAKETIKMMGDSTNYMLEAQRDMLELEVEHFREASVKFTIVLLTVVVICVTLVYLFDKGIFHV